jgi:hypothetical protein
MYGFPIGVMELTRRFTFDGVAMITVFGVPKTLRNHGNLSSKADL